MIYVWYCVIIFIHIIYTYIPVYIRMYAVNANSGSEELKLMAMGLLSGIRALAWAIVLLMVAMQHWCCRAKPEHSWQLPNRARQNNMVRSCQTNVFQCFSYIYIWHFSRQSLKWSDHGWGMFEHASVTCCFPNVAKVMIYMISIVTKSFFGDYHEEFSTVGVWASVIVCVILASGSIAWWIWFANSCQMFAGFLISPSLCNSVRNKSFCISEALLRIFEAGMFTLFRCFTEACETYEGDPIPEKLYLR